MKYDTNDQIRSSIADLTERLRQARVEQGLPPEAKPRPEVVEMPLSLALVERLQPFRAIAIKYAAILAAGQVTRIDTDKLAEYEEMVRLLRRSVGFWCGMHALGAGSVLATMKRLNTMIDEGKAGEINISDEMRKLHIFIGWMTKDSGLDHDLFDQHGKYDMDARKEAKRLLSDPSALKAEIDAARAQIKPEEDDVYE
ncbi:hypothetical protein [Paenibacillus sp. 7541]|uniref:hypothetical protein n=1 Tax=Paenibacillus sp. 7541 TaxID=2026236 RepID=UPI000BA6A5B5|nr:hypothetical protein [Paenibacillus sp. 7541]PAK55420.1 hypothetical protein CHH75_04030 [Paenibacillus sp. 7541]